MELIRFSKENRKLRTQLQAANQAVHQLELDKNIEVCLFDYLDSTFLNKSFFFYFV